MAELRMGIYDRLLTVQAALESTIKQFDQVVRIIGEVIYENEQYMSTVKEMMLQIHRGNPELALDAGSVTLARFGAEKEEEEGSAQSPVQA